MIFEFGKMNILYSIIIFFVLYNGYSFITANNVVNFIIGSAFSCIIIVTAMGYFIRSLILINNEYGNVILQSLVQYMTPYNSRQIGNNDLNILRIGRSPLFQTIIDTIKNLNAKEKEELAKLINEIIKPKDDKPTPNDEESEPPMTPKDEKPTPEIQPVTPPKGINANLI